MPGVVRRRSFDAAARVARIPRIAFHRASPARFDGAGGAL
ncbi:hypothetical protein BTH_I1185 [Burkholderia thailandensis E264]|uniref:Uncharacterized protein n=1 Tax=Burkholderia thailandensis (strain ATCC 700388 / DSM 13276 / CCUG 48851 / CIP 106301 / E264) TaxID=271848 RepID=Q2SZB7_BURTA|nr:hypothetical protein BTH_I1185 [Burkholderia thailandensis E264]